MLQRSKQLYQPLKVSREIHKDYFSEFCYFHNKSCAPQGPAHQIHKHSSRDTHARSATETQQHCKNSKTLLVPAKRLWKIPEKADPEKKRIDKYILQGLLRKYIHFFLDQNTAWLHLINYTLW